MANQYTLLRYVPDLVKGEFVNLAVVLFDEQGRFREARAAGEKELHRLRYLHPAADLDLLRATLQQLAQPDAWADSGLLEEMSTSFLLTSRKGLMDQDVDGLFQRHIAAPPQVARDTDNTRVVLRRRVETSLKVAGVYEYLHPFPVADFTAPGDSFKVDYAYVPASNGRRKFLHAVTLDRATPKAAQLALVFERMRRSRAHDEMTAVHDGPPALATPARGLLESAGITVRPFAEMQDVIREIRRDLAIG